MAYIGNGPGVASQRIVSTFEPTTDTTTFSPSSGYTVGYVDVYLNGVKLQNGTDFTASNGSSVVLTAAAVSGDFVEILAFIPRGLSDGYTKSEADTRYLQPTGDGSQLTGINTDLVSDTTPQLGGNLDGQSYNITTTGTVSATSFTGDGSSLTGIDALPSQTGESGNYLTTDGSTASWAALDTDANTTTKGLYEHAHTISANYTITSGNNAMSAGPVTVDTGYSVTVPTGSTWTIV